ncbi:kinase-like domain-containing protein, partial [Alternaria rosae]|uniref:kinase-like domain-containing protein n=1 Tax=Alternaria rosae TaxID=1187941 RepID=UPI001E8D7295
YQHMRMLGHGGSASVEQVLDLVTGSVFARKIIRNVYSRNVEDAKRKLLNEIRIMQRLPHHHIVRVHSTRIEGRELTMILDPAADGGDLANYLQNYRDQGFHSLGEDISKENARQNRVLRRSFGCLASALDFIHRQTVRHKDIKPQNILIHKGKVMYTDFGLSYDFGVTGRSTTTGNPQGITRRYCAPEVAEWGRRNTKSDVFSLGCVFIEMVLALENDASYDQIYEGNFQEIVRSF